MIELSQLEIISGFSSIIGIMFAFILGFLMISKYFKYKDRNLLLMGLVVILVSQAWWPYAITLMLFFAGGECLPLQMYLIIGLSLQTITLLLGMYVMTNLLWKDKIKLVMALTAIYGTLCQIILFYAMFVDPSRFATLEGPLDVRYQSWLALFLFLNIIFVVIPAFFFFQASRKSHLPEIRLKGTLFFISIVSYAIGAFLDAVLPLSLILLVIVRTLLTFAAFGTYAAFAMPKWMEKLFLKKESEIDSEESAEDEHAVSQFLHLLKAKPKEITEEEVKFYREQTVCLVCKNQLVKYALSYFCQDCRALYCAKCARAISKLENACWACNAPVDESKPVKLFKKDEELSDIEISEETRKKQIK